MHVFLAVNVLTLKPEMYKRSKGLSYHDYFLILKRNSFIILYK